VVTLRGPVDSADEKTKVEALAKSASGVKRVESQLEIARD
jgi:osmotically-inducible protein OsmY